MMNNKNEMNGARIIGYGLGSLGKDFALGVMGSYLLLFYTDIFGISAGAAGMIFLLTKIWDAVNDPMMGGDCRQEPGYKKRKIQTVHIIYMYSPFRTLCTVFPFTGF